MDLMDEAMRKLRLYLQFKYVDKILKFESYE